VISQELMAASATYAAVLVGFVSTSEKVEDACWSAFMVTSIDVDEIVCYQNG
jgi:hypothetical protein